MIYSREMLVVICAKGSGGQWEWDGEPIPALTGEERRMDS